MRPKTQDEWDEHTVEVASNMITRAIELRGLALVMAPHIQPDFDSLLTEAFNERPGYFTSRDELSKKHSGAVTRSVAPVLNYLEEMGEE